MHFAWRRLPALAAVLAGVFFFLTAPAVSQQAGGRLSWLTEGALYEGNIEYFPNHSIEELTEQMPRLEKLGVKAVYLTPVWECVGNRAQYLILNYYKMNPRYGTKAGLRRLVEVAHEHGIRILLDFVTSLTYDGSYIMKNHPEWILRGDDGSKQRYFPFPDWGWALDAANEEFIEYMAGVARHYVEEFDIDGWRIDSPLNNYDPAKVSGDHSRVKLLRAAKAAVTSVKPEAIFLSEVASPTLLWGEDDADDPPLFDEMCELSYNYPFCGFMGGSENDGYSYIMAEGTPAKGVWKPTLLDKTVKGQASSEEFVSYIQNQPILHGRTRANFLENHDTERVQKAFPEKHRALFVLIAAMPGVPVIHAGQEIGAVSPADASGAEAEKQRVDFSNRDRELEAFYGKVMSIRANRRAVQEGEFRNVWNGPKGVIAFARRRGREVVLTAVNFAAQKIEGALSLPLAEWELEPATGYRLREQFTDDVIAGEDLTSGAIEVALPPAGYRVWVLEKP